MLCPVCRTGMTEEDHHGVFGSSLDGLEIAEIALQVLGAIFGITTRRFREAST